MERSRADLTAVRSARSENSDDDEHDPEGATMSQLWSQSSGLLQGAERDLVALDPPEIVTGDLVDDLAALVDRAPVGTRVVPGVAERVTVPVGGRFIVSVDGEPIGLAGPHGQS